MFISSSSKNSECFRYMLLTSLKLDLYSKICENIHFEKFCTIKSSDILNRALQPLQPSGWTVWVNNFDHFFNFRNAMLSLLLKPSRNTSPRWARLSVPTKMACKKSAQRKLFPETSLKFPVSYWKTHRKFQERIRLESFTKTNWQYFEGFGG